ncbi:MAG: RNA polymerase sigma factor [Anaerolineales bacterium]
MELSSLAERAVEDPDAFAALYQSLYSSTYNYVRYRCDDRGLAEELTSRVFLRLLEKIGSYQSEKGPFKPWFYALTRNVIADYFRFEKLRFRKLREVLFSDLEGSQGPESGFIQDEWKQELLDAMRGLNQRERDLLGLKFAFDLSYRDMAEITGLSESNVGVILYRSISKLRDWMVHSAREKRIKSRSMDEAVDNAK